MSNWPASTSPTDTDASCAPGSAPAPDRCDGDRGDGGDGACAGGGQPGEAEVAGRAQERLVLVVAHDGVLVAVGLRDRLPADPRRLPAVGVLSQQFGERDRLLAEPLDVAVTPYRLA